MNNISFKDFCEKIEKFNKEYNSYTLNKLKKHKIFLLNILNKMPANDKCKKILSAFIEKNELETQEQFKSGLRVYTDWNELYNIKYDAMLSEINKLTSLAFYVIAIEEFKDEGERNLVIETVRNNKELGLTNSGFANGQYKSFATAILSISTNKMMENNSAVRSLTGKNISEILQKNKQQEIE